VFLQRSFLDEASDRVVQCHVSPTNRSRARAPIGLQNVAVDGDLHVREQFETGDRAQRSTDQSLNLLGATGLLASSGLATGALGVEPGSIEYSA